MSITGLVINPEDEIKRQKEQAELVEWVERAARRVGVDLRVHGARREGDYLAVPVHVANEGWDAVDKAAALQKIEDDWNYPVDTEERPTLTLLLVPTAD